MRQVGPINGGQNPPAPFLLTGGNPPQLRHNLDQQDRGKPAGGGNQHDAGGGASGLQGDNPVNEEKRMAVWKICDGIMA